MWYEGSFVLAAVGTGALYVGTRQKKAVAKTGEFLAFQRNYLTAYLLAMFADWLQGPYVYKLYSEYGFDKEAIAQLFVCGFMSSMVVGTFVGGLADKYGRRRMCLVFSVCYSVSALTKLVNSYWVLMLGRFLSGIATSLLYSAFEAWMVCEHNRRGFDPELLGDTFSTATLGNGLVAVLAGLVAEALAAHFGSVGPFVFALVPLNLLLLLVLRYWPENYGDSSVAAGLAFRHAWATVTGSQRVLCLGLAQACFEGAMYTFVFMWNPALDPTIEGGPGRSLPLGLIFATFMVCIMAGSFAFTLLARGGVERVPFVLHTAAAASMGLVALCVESENTVYLCFLVFELCCGIFFPAYGTLRSAVIPEETRAAVMNLFRIPLNAFVVLLLLKVKYLPTPTVFFVCTAAHAAALVLYTRSYSAPGAKEQFLS